MKRFLCRCALLALLVGAGHSIAAAGQQPSASRPSQAKNAKSRVARNVTARCSTLVLPTSKRLFLPIPGASQLVNSFPVSMALSPDGRYAVLLNDGYGTAESGFRQSLAVLDLKTNQLSDFPDDRLGNYAHQSFFQGLQFGSDGRHVFASVGSITDPTGEMPGDLGNGIAVYSFDAGKIAPSGFLKLPLRSVASEKIAAPVNRKIPSGQLIPYPAGLAVVQGPKGDRLLIADNLADDALLLDATTGEVVHRFELSTQKIVPGSYPYTAVATRDGKRGYVSLWNASRVAELDLESGKLIRLIPVHVPARPIVAGSHPTALLLSPEESRLYVALANEDEVEVVSSSDGSVLARISARLPRQKYLGAYPNALAQSADGRRLYIADAGVNAVAVVDVSGISREAGMKGSAPLLQPLGFIPTDWYPLAVAARGDDLLISSGKGEGTGPNGAPVQVHARGGRREYPYIFEILHGSIARLNRLEAESHLAELTQEVLGSNFSRQRSERLSYPGGKNPIHHVIYIIKENRTYDQVLGDLKEGNGDPSLVMFGQEITPNQHQLAREFGILDNFYASGEVSGDGHDWSTAGIASDYLEKTVQINYRGSAERPYDYEGEVANRFPLEDDIPDVNETGTGYIWTNVARHGLSYRHYGEFVATRWCNQPTTEASPREGTPSPEGAPCPRSEVKKGEPLPSNLGQPHGSASPWPWPVPLIARNVATKPELRGHFDPYSADWSLEFPDQLRVDEFLNEFDKFVQARKTGKGIQLPDYVLLRLPNDHTSGTHPGRATPAAAVADNDLAVGRVVEAVSNSPYWDDTAILIVEDDAQDGPDHVDAHRSTAYVISKYSPGSAERPSCDHHFYTTVAMVRTIEVLLGLPPMNFNDAQSPWIAPLFSGPGHQGPFRADYRNRDNGLIYQMNPPVGPDAEASEALDFSHADRADSVKLNEILWRNRMGPRPLPAIRYTVMPAAELSTDSSVGKRH